MTRKKTHTMTNKEWKKKYPKIKMDRELFNKKVDDGQIMIGGLCNAQGVYLTRITKNWVWFIR